MNAEGSSPHIALSSTSQVMPDPNISIQTMNSPDRSATKSLAERLQKSMLYDNDDSTLASQSQEPDEASLVEEDKSSAFAHEERRLLEALAMSCHRIQQQEKNRDEAILNADNVSTSHSWSLLLDSLHDLSMLWSSTPNASSGIRRHQNKGTNHDLDIESILSHLLTVWQLAIEGNDPMKRTPALLSTIKVVALMSKEPLGKNVLFQLRMEKLALLIPCTMEFLLKTSASAKASLMGTEDHIPMHEEKKNDEMPSVDANHSVIEEALSTNDAGIKTLFQLIRDVAMNWRPSSKSTYDDFVSQILPTMLQRCFYSNPLFMTDISAILWKWSVSSAHRLVRDNGAWEAIEYMWVICYEHESQRISTFLESESGSKILSNLAASVGTMISSIFQDETATHSMTLAELHEVEIVQKQEWLIRYLINEISGSLVDSRDGCRRRCMRILWCLAASYWGRNLLWNQISQGELVVVLLQVMRTVEEDVDTRALACQTLEFIARERIEEVHLGPYVETTLIEIIEGDRDVDDNDSYIRDISSCKKLIISACEALTQCLKCSPWSRSPECFTEMMFENLLHLLHSNVDQPKYHSIISELFVQLVAKPPHIEGPGESSTSTRIKGICTVIASYPSALETFAMLLSPSCTKSEFDKVRKDTIEVLSVLIETDNIDKTNQRLMAADEYLLTALVNVCLMNTNESPLKDEAKRIILTLIPEL
jgi:hypothetical protein